MGTARDWPGDAVMLVLALVLAAGVCIVATVYIILSVLEERARGG